MSSARAEDAAFGRAQSDRRARLPSAGHNVAGTVADDGPRHAAEVGDDQFARLAVGTRTVRGSITSAMNSASFSAECWRLPALESEGPLLR